MGLFSRNEGVPDVGKEDVYEEEKEKKLFGLKKAEKEIPPVIKVPVKTTNVIDIGERSQLEFQKINARIESITEWIKQFYERFSYVSESIGSIRNMALNNEKQISKISLEAQKSFDIVKEVKPEKLRIDYQKIDIRIKAIEEKLTMNKQFSDIIMNELKDLKRRAGIFIGTDALLKLNEDVKKDLIELQKMGARVRMNSDKSEQLFIELRKGFAENQKLNQVFSNLDVSYSGLQKEIGKLKLDYSNILTRNDFSDFKKNTENKLITFENEISEIEKIKEENERLAKLVETTLSIAKKNEEDIGKIGVSLGDDRIEKVSDYENKFSKLLEIIDKISNEVNRIRKKIRLEPLAVKKAEINVEKKDEKKKENVKEELKKPPKEVERGKPPLKESEKKLPMKKVAKKL